MPQLAPAYNPNDVEERLYARWEAAGLFRADADPRRRPYTIVIPPPNITGILHMGHALNNTIQDILIRTKRMQGKNALWVPGTDHAGIATQNVVEKMLAKEGKSRQDLGREAFRQRVWTWKEQYGSTIIRQLKRLGASCDWTRTRFTMDEGLSAAVVEVFIRLYEAGLIYRGNYIINWCPRCQTALADEEAPRQETMGKLYHIRYPLAGGSRLEARAVSRKSRATSHEPRAPCIDVATTRPATMLGDTAVAVHPKDKRYKGLVGRHALLPLVNRRLPIIADPLVDPEFGTGAVKVTPAHDPVDFQLGTRHGLEFINVMTDDARMTNVPAAYQSLDRFDCRSKLIVDLEQQGFLGRIEEHQHNVGHCYRCHTVVEPRLSLQWFVRMKPLAQSAIRAVTSGKIRFVPDRWRKVYLNWMRNIQDWCISRQIWWGHRLPVWYCANCARGSMLEARGEGRRSRATSHEPRATSEPGVIVSKARPTRCPACGGADLKQDEDVLDTWFSSWLWPFSTLGWPKQTKDLAYFYPTDTLVTAPEIIFFWVARMIMAGFFCMKEIPFRRVYIHGTVRDITGKKMSKSLGNIIDPLEVIDRYGTDALRYTLVTATAIGQDIALSEERFAAGRNFANKLWNAARYVLSAAGGSGPEAGGHGTKGNATSREPRPTSVSDCWILSRLQRTIEQVTSALDAFSIHEAAATLYSFLWHDVCDWYLEITKISDGETEDQRLAILTHVLETGLRLLHPIMPFVTEELWQHLTALEARGLRLEVTARRAAPRATSIMVAPWPNASKRLVNPEAERWFEQFRSVVVTIRNLRAELNIPLDSRPAVHLVTAQAPAREFFGQHQRLLQALARVGGIRVDGAIKRPRDAAAAVVDGIQIFVPLGGLIDVARERNRLSQRVGDLEQDLSRQQTRLRDPQFVEKAPKDVVEQARQREAQTRQTLEQLRRHLDVLRAM